MIDPHVHLRDWNQSKKETLGRGLMIAYYAGLDAVFEMPNTDPALTSVSLINKRITLADKTISDLGLNEKIFHGLYGGITSDPGQIEAMAAVHSILFPRVVGLKMFAGHSTGNMGIIDEEDQRRVYKTLSELGYQGVLAVHCEKESLLHPKKWNPKNPYSHTLARPPNAEFFSVNDQIMFARDAGYKGTLHICHISVPASLYLVETIRNYGVPFKITCGLTPHHAMMYDEMMKEENGILLKMNPPLRPKDMQQEMLQALINRRIDWIETDHAPHTLQDKTKTFASGIPGIPYYPHFIKYLKEQKGFSQEKIEDVTHNNIVKAFGINIPNRKKNCNYQLERRYEVDAFSHVREK